MIRALIWKELRETWWLAAIAFVFLMWSFGKDAGLVQILKGEGVANLHSSQIDFIPLFRNSHFRESLPYTALGLGIALGIWQTLSEDGRATWQFLLQHPLSRMQIVATKLATGAFLVTFTPVVATAMYSVWAATPGTHASPFYWWLLAPEMWLAAPLALIVYFAAFATAIRPARWVGSRLAPLVSGVAAAGIVVGTALGDEAIVTAVLIAAASALLLLAVVVHSVHTRDFA